LKARDGEECIETVSANKSCFRRFQRQFSHHNRSLHGEAASVEAASVEAASLEAASVEAAEECLHVLGEIIQKGGHQSEQTFNVDKTGLFWKKCSK
ncbi:tigger transposable element-derived protein 1, partial [Biomphalaria glabrata]